VGVLDGAGLSTPETGPFAGSLLSPLLGNVTRREMAVLGSGLLASEWPGFVRESQSLGRGGGEGAARHTRRDGQQLKAFGCDPATIESMEERSELARQVLAAETIEGSALPLLEIAKHDVTRPAQVPEACVAPSMVVVACALA
jgi:hypothetical protein